MYSPFFPAVMLFKSSPGTTFTKLLTGTWFTFPMPSGWVCTKVLLRISLMLRSSPAMPTGRYCWYERKVETLFSLKAVRSTRVSSLYATLYSSRRSRSTTRFIWLRKAMPSVSRPVRCIIRVSSSCKTDGSGACERFSGCSWATTSASPVTKSFSKMVSGGENVSTACGYAAFTSWLSSSCKGRIPSGRSVLKYSSASVADSSLPPFSI